MPEAPAAAETHIETETMASNVAMVSVSMWVSAAAGASGIRRPRRLLSHGPFDHADGHGDRAGRDVSAAPGDGVECQFDQELLVRPPHRLQPVDQRQAA